MKKYSFRVFLVVLLTVLSVYLLYPTYKDYQNTKKINETVETLKKIKLKNNPGMSKKDLDKFAERVEDSLRTSDPDIAATRAKRIKLGLDLQGGMYLALEVNTAKMLEKIGKNQDETFKQVLKESEKEAQISDKDIADIFVTKLKQRGVRLSRYFGSVREDEDKIADNIKKQSTDAVDRAMEIIRNRIDKYGVSEPSIQKQGSRRIIVELPGISKKEEARQLLQGRAQLEFRIVKDPQFAYNVMTSINNILAGKATVDTTKDSTAAATKDVAKKDSGKANDAKGGKKSKAELEKENPLFSIMGVNPYTADGFTEEKNVKKLQAIFNRPDVKNAIPANVEFVFSEKGVKNQDGKNIFSVYMLNKKPELTGAVITDAQANIDPTTNSPVVSMQMNSEGAIEWARITGANIKKRCAIVLDGVVYSAPVIQNKIPNGSSQITGSGTMEEAKILEIILKAGALPAPVEIVEERSVGPSLGQDSVNNGFLSVVFAFLAIGIFMAIYYQVSGVVADIALFLIILFIVACLAGFSATLTMPGIAGLVLTMGMAVDANVLIFERIREELAHGKTMKAAITAGFSHSYAAVIDTHLTTLITSIILFQFGTGPVQGFALTLMIGILSTLFGALVASRIILDVMADKGYKVSIG